MKRLLLKLSLLSAAVALPVYIWASVAFDGRSDAFYLRFATPRAPSLIFGSSRGAQAIRPAVVNDSQLEFERPMFNFSFTHLNSPYGESYLNLGLRKLAPGTKNGLYILEVDPWALSVQSEAAEAQQDARREAGLFVSEIETVDSEPNLEYIFGHFGKPLYAGVIKNDKVRLARDGWLDVSGIDMSDAAYAERLKGRLAVYEKHAKNWQLSDYRLEQLREFVRAFSEHGLVAIVRLPIGPELLSIEQGYAPALNERLREIAGDEALYLDLTNVDVKTTDGHHIHRDDSQRITKIIAEKIADQAGELPGRRSVR